MIEKLKNKKGNYLPCEEVIECLGKMKAERGGLCVAEIGVDIGATAVEILRLLGKDDKYFFFDVDSVVRELNVDFRELNTEAQLFGIGNSLKTLDSYAWSLARLKIEQDTKFDLVYLDGAHTFLHDASATAVLKEMMKIGGIIVFDDLDWTISSSPTCNPDKNPSVLDRFTKEQIDTCQIDYVVRTIMDPDKRYRKLDMSTSRRALYERCS